MLNFYPPRLIKPFLKLMAVSCIIIFSDMAIANCICGSNNHPFYCPESENYDKTQQPLSPVLDALETLLIQKQLKGSDQFYEKSQTFLENAKTQLQVWHPNQSTEIARRLIREAENDRVIIQEPGKLTVEQIPINLAELSQIISLLDPLFTAMGLRDHDPHYDPHKCLGRFQAAFWFSHIFFQHWHQHPPVTLEDYKEIYGLILGNMLEIYRQNKAGEDVLKGYKEAEFLSCSGYKLADIRSDRSPREDDSEKDKVYEKYTNAQNRIITPTKDSIIIRSYYFNRNELAEKINKSLDQMGCPVFGMTKGSIVIKLAFIRLSDERIKTIVMPGMFELISTKENIGEDIATLYGRFTSVTGLEHLIQWTASKLRLW